MNFSIKINAIKLSKKTVRLTKTNSFEQLMSIKDTLFNKLSDNELMTVIEDIYNGKLATSHKEEILGYSTEEKRKHAIGTLSVQLELVQELARVKDENAPTNVVGIFLRNRLNVSNQVSKKMFWQTTTLEVVDAYQYNVGEDFTDIMKQEGMFTYLYRENSFTPEIDKDSGKVITSPKRLGADGHILLKNDKLIFLRTYLVVQEIENEDQFNELYDGLVAKELANSIEFKHDSLIDIVENDIPNETRTDVGFNSEFQSWLHEKLNISEGMQVKVA